jgi:hypothetical protein
MSEGSLGCSIGIATDIPDRQPLIIERSLKASPKEERQGDVEEVGRFRKGKVGWRVLERYPL